MTAMESDSVLSIFHATSAAELALLKTEHSADSSWRLRDPSRHLGQRTRQHLEHRLPAAASATVALRHSVHGSSLLLGGLKPGPMTRFHSNSSSSNGLNIMRGRNQLEDVALIFVLSIFSYTEYSLWQQRSEHRQVRSRKYGMGSNNPAGGGRRSGLWSSSTPGDNSGSDWSKSGHTKSITRKGHCYNFLFCPWLSA